MAPLFPSMEAIPLADLGKNDARRRRAGWLPTLQVPSWRDTPGILA